MSARVEVVELETRTLAGEAIDLYLRCRKNGLTIPEARAWTEGCNRAALRRLAAGGLGSRGAGDPGVREYVEALLPWGVETCSRTLDLFVRFHEHRSLRARTAKRRTLAKIVKERPAPAFPGTKGAA